MNISLNVIIISFIISLKNHCFTLTNSFQNFNRYEKIKKYTTN
ncbi:hypothetical protein DDI_3236 [Dickeya dianthicola RNS04.9]|nr:hypothetical protein DDI_3236 [Dickeya dianthicola RNS04.9]